jgi:hypothetical protein
MTAPLGRSGTTRWPSSESGSRTAGRASPGGHSGAHCSVHMGAHGGGRSVWKLEDAGTLRAEREERARQAAQVGVHVRSRPWLICIDV